MIPRRYRPPARRRRSFTLIELLIAISIVALLSTAVVFTMMGAMEEARVSRAQSQVKRINELLMRRWEEYRTRPVPIRVPPGAGGQATMLARLNALRAVMRYELPDRISDLNTPSGKTNPWPLPPPGIAPPSLALAYNRKVAAQGGFSAWSQTHESSECLYLILSCMRSGDQVALDGFQPSEIGDTDGDGFPEILDPWGNPIHFLRWAPLFQSPLQNMNPASPVYAPDPFDPFKAGVLQGSPPNWAIYPLIYSAGSDARYGIDEGPPGYPYYMTPQPWPNNPYYTDSSVSPPIQIGTVGAGWGDNIHNHYLE